MADPYITGMAAAAALTGDELLEVSQLSATVTMTATTLSADGDDNSYNDSANGFITEGFAVGNRVKVAGFTGNVANNIQVGRITALTAGKMTIGGTDGDVIVDDAAGESVTITKWETRRTTAQEIADLAGSGATVRPIAFFFTTTPTASEVLLLYTAGESITLADDFTGSVGDVGTNPTASFAMDVQKNGVSVGTITISTGGAFTFATSGAAVSLAAGDQLKVVGPGSADATCSNVSITLKGAL